jgi:hypothetical protein
MTIDEQWQSLEVEAAGGAGWRLQLARPIKGHPLFVAVEGARRALLLRVPASAIPPRHLWPTCKGLEVQAVQLTGHAHLGVALLEPRFGDVFSALAEDLVRRVEQEGGEPTHAVAVFIGQLSRWQRFLASSSTGLSGEAQRGLWGELHCLHTRLLPALGGAAVTGWKGPQGAHQDFQFPRAWIEVKTTLAKQPQTVRITSERQLDDSHAPALFLHVLVLETQEGGVATLPALVAQVRTSLNAWPASRESFEDALLAVGYLDLHAPRYSGIGYGVRQTEDFLVQPAFPRIVETDLPSGVGDASYHLSLAACSEFIVGPEKLAAALLPPAA